MTSPKSDIHALDYLAKPPAGVPSVCVLSGGDPFLKREVFAAIRDQVLGDGDGEFCESRLSGETTEAHEVFDALATRGLFGGERRLVSVQRADAFVTRCRKPLEDYFVRPATSGVLVLDMAKWVTRSRLHAALTGGGIRIDCTAPKRQRVRSWLPKRAASPHGAKLSAQAALLLLETVGLDLGLLDQELARLALLAGPDRCLTETLIHESAGDWRVRSTWDLIDAAAEGRVAEALTQLDRIIVAGEHPISILAQLASTLRRFSAAADLVEACEASRQPVSLSAVLAQAGFPPFVLKKAEKQLKQVGRPRAHQIRRWLLDADIALKGVSSALPRARLELEKIIVRLATAADPRTIRQSCSR
ncbi:MAG: DNA polymerase III subunit delta [Pirellulales bacterium]